jgi:hypothetical protein
MNAEVVEIVIVDRREFKVSSVSNSIQFGQKGRYVLDMFEYV